MLLLQDTWCGEQPNPAGAEHRRGIPHAKGLKKSDLLIKRPVQFRQLHGSIHPQYRFQVGTCEDAARVLLKTSYELRDGLRFHGKARGLSVPAEALKKVTRGGEGLEQVKALNGTSRSDADPVLDPDD